MCYKINNDLTLEKDGKKYKLVDLSDGSPVCISCPFNNVECGIVCDEVYNAAIEEPKFDVDNSVFVEIKPEETDYKALYEEEYEKYENAVNELRNLRNMLMEQKVINADGVINANLERIFPELRESEDERIRKEILEFFSQFENGKLRGVDISSWIAWLEKRKEQEPVEQEPTWSEENSCYYDDICEILINLINSPKSNVNKDVVQKDLDWLMSVRESQSKPSWSEEDERIRYAICDTLDRIDEHIMEYNRQLTHQQVKDWLKSLKERVQSQPKWSEKDEEMRIDAIKYLEIFDAQGIHGDAAQPCIDWLKSLKDRMN